MSDQVRIDDTTVCWAGRYYPCPTIAAAHNLVAEINFALNNGVQPFVPWAWYRGDRGRALVFLPSDDATVASDGPQGNLPGTMLQLAQPVLTAHIAHEMAFEHNKSMDSAMSPRF